MNRKIKKALDLFVTMVLGAVGLSLLALCVFALVFGTGFLVDSCLGDPHSSWGDRGFHGYLALVGLAAVFFTGKVLRGWLKKPMY